jgi:hypothetical protein
MKEPSQKRTFLLIIVFSMLSLVITGCVAPGTPEPSYAESVPEPVPDWVGKDYHDIQQIESGMRLGHRIEDFDYGKRIQFSWLESGGIKIDYLVKTDRNGIITSATKRRFNAFR